MPLSVFSSKLLSAILHDLVVLGGLIIKWHLFSSLGDWQGLLLIDLSARTQSKQQNRESKIADWLAFFSPVKARSLVMKRTFSNCEYWHHNCVHSQLSIDIHWYPAPSSQALVNSDLQDFSQDNFLGLLCYSNRIRQNRVKYKCSLY